jgi:chromosome segregation ATPase
VAHPFTPPRKHIKADAIERTVVQKLSDLSQNEASLQISVEELNGDLKRKTEPLEQEAGQIERRLEEIDGEIGRYVKALGQGKLSIQRLETEIAGLETDKCALQLQPEDLERKTNESAARDFNSELLQRTLPDFRTAFAALTALEQSEALQCVLKTVTVYPKKLDPEIFELQEFLPGSQNREEWLPFVDTYRTFCLAPGPEAKEILPGIQRFTPLSALRHRDGILFAP